MNSANPQIAYFITPHGFGHAARAIACMEALQTQIPGVGWHLFTQVPEWFFHSSGIKPIRYHALPTDVGLVQRSPWEADLAATLASLNRLLPFSPGLIASLAEILKAGQCRMVISDIAALGIAVARHAGLPSVLVENFTWDWIYTPLSRRHAPFRHFSQILADWYAAADHHIQAGPWCAEPATPPRLQTFPVSRKPRTGPAQVRRSLNIPGTDSMVLVTMGGVPDQTQPPLDSPGLDGITLVIPGDIKTMRRSGSVIRLPYQSPFYHPDLIHAADAVVGKAGYSTLAEACQAGVPFGYISRENFRESAVLSRFIQDQMSGLTMPAAFWNQPQGWTTLRTLLNLPLSIPPPINGADQIANYLKEILM